MQNINETTYPLLIRVHAMNPFWYIHNKAISVHDQYHTSISRKKNKGKLPILTH